MTTGTIVLLIICGILILTACIYINNLIKSNQKTDELIEKAENLKGDSYSDFISNSKLVSKLKANKTLNIIGSTEGNSYNKLVTLFNNAKNPWGITPTIFTAIRIVGGIAGIILGIVISLILSDFTYIIFGLIISAIAIFYPVYYYKEVAKEREQEWNKIYEFIWVVKHTCMLYDAKKVCIETRDYVAEHYPKYKEIIQGLTDFAEYWQDDEIPEYILKYYNFAIPKELYNILFNMNLTGTSPESNLDNLRSFALNRHNSLIQKTLSSVPSTSTLATLPFLMLIVIVVLLVPMILRFIDLL